MAGSSCSSDNKKNVDVPKVPLKVVYIMCDDHSYQTISAYDHRYIETPNIDRIADEGARFTNSFVANSLSGPSGTNVLKHLNSFLHVIENSSS